MAVNCFWDERAIVDSGSSAPTILAIGDSWFWHPFPGGCLVRNLGEIVKSRGHVIFAKGMNGAEAFDYVDGKYSRCIYEALRLYGRGLDAVFISGAGNDFAGFTDLRPLLKEDCSGEATAAGCFAPGSRGLRGFLDRMDTYYRKLIGLVYTHTARDCLIVMHSYDYPVPAGEGVFGGEGWLQPALDAAGVPKSLQQACVVHLLDCFHKVLQNICRVDPEHLFVVDSRGTLSRKDWANELHPRARGFEKIARQCWQPLLQHVGLAH